MRVFILSLLAVSSVNSHTINYPYNNQLLAYAPARGEFPVYSDVAQGYVRYYDSNGAEHQLGYKYPEPLYGIRRLSYALGNNANPFIRTSSLLEPSFNAASYYQIQDSSELAKAREEHFRRWCEQRYQALKAEMDKFRAEGIKPSSDFMAQFQPLEKIITSTTYNSFAESPEIKSIRDEHLRIWNEARLKVLQQEAEHLRFGNQKQSAYDLKSSVGGIIGDVNAIVGETVEQKKAREENLRIYNEQLQRVKQLEAERLQQINDQNKENTQINKDQFQQGAIFQLKSSLEQGQQQVQQQQQQLQQVGQIMDTPEVIRAREEHLRLVNEAKLRAQAEGSYNSNDDGSYKPEKIEASPVLKFAPSLQQPIQPVQNIAIVQAAQPTQQGLLQQQQSTYVKSASADFSQQQPAQLSPVQDTPEVIRAREEHLKLFNEAKLKASQQTDLSSNFQQSEKAETYAFKSDDDDKIRESERIREEEKQREMERLREIERKKEQERLLEAERLRLKQEEELRLEKERFEESKRLKEEEEKRSKDQQSINFSSSSLSGIQSAEQLNSQLKNIAAQKIEGSSSLSGASGSPSGGGGLSGITAGSGFVLSSQYKNNPYLLRFGAQPGTNSYIVGNQQATVGASPNLYYIPAKIDPVGTIPKANPFLLRFSQGGLQAQDIQQQQQQLTGNQQAAFKPIAGSEKISTYSSAGNSGSSSSYSSGSSSSSSSGIKLDYASSYNAGSISELEKATREHFRAHEIALEQLRLAKIKNPSGKDCN